MVIKGPLTLNTADKMDGTGKEIFLGFTEEFRLQELDQQKLLLDSYMQELADAIRIEMDDRERQGMLMIQQIMVQLYPHIVSGEMDLDEELVIDVQPGAEMNFNNQ